MTTQPRGKVTVVTATIGHPQLRRALLSVQAQGPVVSDHFVLVDGPQFEAAVRPVVEDIQRTGPAPTLMVLPRNTGANGWCSHRIYAAIPFLLDSDFIVYLDHDNWFDAGHVQSLLRTAAEHDVPAAYSLRKIYDSEGRFVCEDNCQSLGRLHVSYSDGNAHQIDTNCWLLARSVAIGLSKYWMRRYTGDRLFSQKVMQLVPNLPCTHQYSLNYTVASREESASAEYFLVGNRQMSEMYPEGLPWRSQRRE